MKKKLTYGLGTKLILILIFLGGFFMSCNFFMVFEETEEIEGIVEHTYISRAYNGVRPAGGSVGSVPMCRVVWYDKEGERVVYGMPNDKDYEVGDSYFFEVDTETNRIPKRSAGEGVAALIIGLIMCVTSIVIWKIKFGKPKKKNRKMISEMEQRRREAYNPETHQAVVRCSICNGEQVAGFKDKKTGHFTEVMLIQKDKDLEEFKERYGLDKVVKEY